MAGRRPTPVELKEGKGNPGKRKMPTPPPRVPGELKPPKHLKGDALECWGRVTELLAARLQLTKDSYESLVCLCETYGDRARLRRALEKDGWVITNDTAAGKQRIPHPAAANYRDADRRYRAWLIEFGLTDASRGKVNVGRPPAPPADGKGAKGEPSKPASAADRYGLN